MTMNLDIVRNMHESSFANTNWDDFLNKLETGLNLIDGREELPSYDLSEMEATNIALSYNRQVMLDLLAF